MAIFIQTPMNSGLKARRAMAPLKPLCVALAAIFNLQPLQAQNVPATPTVLPPVVVTSSASGRELVSEFLSVGDMPLTATPVSAVVIGSAQIEAQGAKRLADLVKTDASVSDAYNAVGYWDYATVRGFVLSNKYNYRREGLPISAETAIALENKASVEILKGTSGIQAGTSAPGGLVNYTVKRPTQNDVRMARMEVNSNGNVMGAADLGGRFGQDKAFGYRINAASEKLDNYASNTQGNRQLLAAAGDWRPNADALFQAEIEYSHRSQPSVPGLSLTGNTLPAPNVGLNLNSQAWSQPVVLDGLTGSLKFEQVLNNSWRWTAQAGSQKLTSQDRVAFPFGCSKEGKADRYCSDGTFDMYDYRSDNEQRNTTAIKVELKGQVETGSVKHGLGFAVQSSRVKDRFDLQAYNLVGAGSIYTTTVLPANAALTSQNTNRTEHNTEFSAYDTVQWNSIFTTWAGLRYTQLQRNSIRTNGSRETDYSDHFAAPWLAASLAVTPTTMAYASYGQGVESEVAPGRARYTNAGQALPALKSKQMELGLKGSIAQNQWTAALFEITRPAFGDLGACGGTATCTRQVDGSVQHYGLELSAASLASSAAAPWHFDGGLSVIKAQRQDSSINPALNGLRPVNAPNWIARLNAEYQVAAVPGLTMQAHLSHEGRRAVVPDNSINLPAWTRVDLGARYKTTIAQTETTWTFGLENAFNKRYFSESPYQFSHVYLFTAAPRTLRLAVQVVY